MHLPLCNRNGWNACWIMARSDGFVVLRKLNHLTLKFNDIEGRFAKWVKIACVLLVFTSTIISIAIGKVVLLVFVGALLQGLMLPFLALAAFYFRIQDYRQVDAEKRSWQHHLGTACLALSTLAMTSAGIYQIWAQMFLWFGA